MRNFIIILFAILVLPVLSHSAIAGTGAITVIVGGKPLDLSPKARMVSGTALIPTECLNSLGAQFEAHGKRVKITSAKGRNFVCQATLINGQPFLPATKVADQLGVAAVWNEVDRTLSLHSIIQRIECTGTELRVSASCPVSAEILDTSWTRKSNKLILDIAGAQFPDDKADLKVVNSSSAAITTGELENGETARIVLNLTGPAGCQLTSCGETTGIVVSIAGLTPTQPAQSAPSAPAPEIPSSPSNTISAISITGIHCLKVNSRQVEVDVDASSPLNFSTSMSRKPCQLFLDFSHAALAAPIEDIAADHPILESVHVGQKDANTVRVTLNLKRVVGFDAKWDDASRRFVITMDLPKGAGGLLSQKVIVIDAGHGGSDDGAKGNGAFEKNCTLPIAIAVQKLLAKTGACAILTRQSDVYLTLPQRVDVAIRHSADFFVSVHCNSCQVPNSISGIETYFHGQDANGRALAQCIHAEVVKASGLPDRRVRADTMLHATGLAVLRGTSAVGIPSTLVEVGFINHSTDGCMIVTPEYQQRVAGAIVAGLKQYVEGNEP